jgi:hypothetical protein
LCGVAQQNVGPADMRTAGVEPVPWAEPLETAVAGFSRATFRHEISCGTVRRARRDSAFARQPGSTCYRPGRKGHCTRSICHAHWKSVHNRRTILCACLRGY